MFKHYIKMWIHDVSVGGKVSTTTSCPASKNRRSDTSPPHNDRRSAASSQNVPDQSRKFDCRKPSQIIALEMREEFAAREMKSSAFRSSVHKVEPGG